MAGDCRLRIVCKILIQASQTDVVLFHVPLKIVPIPDRYVLTLDEIATIQAYRADMNSSITQFADFREFAIADLTEVYEKLNTGMVYNGVSMSTEFVSGGAFSLDGLNLNPIGNALLANEYIKAINDQYNARIPLAPVTNYPGVYFP